MLDDPQNEFLNTPLNPDLLSTPFKVHTNWVAISGASCSGKSTMIDQLAAEGFQTVPEAGRTFFERELAKGRAIEDIRADPAGLTRQIYALWLQILNELDPDDLLFHDRGLPDGFGFYRFAGMNPNEILPDCFQHRFASVFILKRLPYLRDGVRVADDKTAAYYEDWMFRDYAALGYDVVQVPVLPPEERLAFVLEKLSDQGLI